MFHKWQCHIGSCRILSPLCTWFLIGGWLIYSVVLVSAIQQHELAIRIHISPLYNVFIFKTVLAQSRWKMWLEQESWWETYQVAVATVLTNSEKSNSRVNRHTHHYRLTVITIWIWTVSSWLCPDWRTCLKNIIFGSGIYSLLSFELDLWKYCLKKKSWTCCYLAPDECLWCPLLLFHRIGGSFVSLLFTAVAFRN